MLRSYWNSQFCSLVSAQMLWHTRGEGMSSPLFLVGHPTYPPCWLITRTYSKRMRMKWSLINNSKSKLRQEEVQRSFWNSPRRSGASGGSGFHRPFRDGHPSQQRASTSRGGYGGVTCPGLATNRSSKDLMVRKLFPLLKASICNKNLKYPALMDLEGLTRAVKGMFQTEIPRLPLAGRLKHFLSAWKNLTGDKEILNIV